LLDELSSSSLGVSSSSVGVSSSSSIAAASSSSVVSSSSAVSSSSTMQSSSSAGLCAGFVDGTERPHEGKNKKQFCDERDGKKYVYVKIDTQIWMAENLNYNASGSLCYGDNTGEDSEGNCAIYGRLYNWATAMGFQSSCNSNSCASQINATHKGVCPSGWHLPSDAEWDKLMTAVGGSSTAGTKLKATSGWNSGGNGQDTYGFAALPGGDVLLNGSFYYVGNGASWWTATEKYASNASNYFMGYDFVSVPSDSSDKLRRYSIRCVLD